MNLLFILFCIQTTAKDSTLFDHLINIWEFNPGPVPGSCELYFLVDFKFQSPLYRQVNLPLVHSLLLHPRTLSSLILCLLRTLEIGFFREDNIIEVKPLANHLLFFLGLVWCVCY